MRTAIEIPQEVQTRLDQLLGDGMMLTAWKLSEAHGRLQDWKPGNALRLAAWIASGVGNDRLSSALDWINWRQDRNNPERAFWALFARMRWKPAVILLPEIDAWLSRTPAAMTDEVYSDFLSLKGWSLATLRDFGPAEILIRQALDLTPGRSWTHVLHSQLLETEDRYEESLAAALRAVELRPSYRPAVLQVVDCLVHLNRDDEAVALLRRTHEMSEHGAFMMRLQGIHSERDEHGEALRCLDEVERLMPLMPPSTSQWLAGRRSDFLYMAGEFEKCLAEIDRTAESDHRRKLAMNLRRPDALARTRKRLAVDFVRQHDMTCAPATLAALAKYWRRDHNHLEIAAAICDEGTPWHKERGWAESNGFIAREFSFNREVLMALIDREIPFTLTTSWVTGAHLQACIGYDDRQGTALLRDPTHRHFGEMLIDDLIEAHPVHGPRCMLLLPHEEAGRLDGITLPDEIYHDTSHELALAIENHDRWAAEAAVSTLRALDTNHPLTLSGEAKLAAYLGHHEKHHAAIARLAARYPDDAPLQYQLFGAMRRIGGQAGLRELLDRMVLIKGADPVFVTELGELLLEDARQLPLAGHFLKRSARLQRRDGRMLESLARHAIKCANFDEAARLRRFASTLSSGWEPYATACFESLRLIGKTRDGVEFLRERTRRGGKMKAAPWLTLAQAFDNLNQHQDARFTLEDAVRLLPDDGELRLKAGRMMIFWGEDDRRRGLEWIDQAKGNVADTTWLRERAWTASALGDRKFAIHFWNSLLDREPLAIDAHRSLARLIAEESGKAEAIRFLTEATRKNPRQPGLWVALADWLGGEHPGAALPALDRALELDPDEVWVLRQRASERFEAGDKTAGLADAREAVERAPLAPESHGVLASLLYKSGEKSLALDSLRRALHLQIDYTFALEHLIHWSRDPASLRGTLAFIEEEMDRQVSNGDCVATYQRCAWPVVPPEDLLASLRKFCDQRPDLWQTWSARIDQCLGMDRLDEARECAERLKESFPLLPRTWTAAGTVEKAAGDHAAQAAALRQAVALSPAWDWAVLQLGEVLERLGRYEEARAALERAINYDPLNGPNHGHLADLLYKMDRKDDAFTGLLAAMDTCPFYQWGWTTLAGWADTPERLLGLEEKIRFQSERLAHNVTWWAIVTVIWQQLDRKEDALEAARAGLAVDPEYHDLRDLVATILCDLERFDEAMEACTPASPTRELDGRRAWVLMRSGDGPAAIAAMKTLLDREPDYAWGWHQLAGWHYERRDWKMLADAARHWTRLCPDSSIAHGHAGLAARELGEAEAARHAFERAFRMDPEYQFAGGELLKLQVAAGAFPEAEATLATLRHYAPGLVLDCEAVALSLARGKEEDAFALAADIQVRADSPVPLVRLQQEFGSRGFATRWREQIESRIKDGTAVSPASLAAWAELSKWDLPRAVKRLHKMSVSEASRDAAWEVLLRAAPDSGNAGLLGKWIGRHRARFSENGGLWNTVGEMLLNFGKPDDAVKWFAGWQQREADVGAHTLVNLSAALDAAQGPQASEEVRAVGITRFRTNDNALYLRAGQACHFAASGRIDEAKQMLAPIEDSRISDFYIGLASLGRSIVAVAEDEEEAERHYRVGLEKLQIWPGDPAVIKHVIPIQEALARLLPWAGGKRRRVAKRWGALAGDSPWPGYFKGLASMSAVACWVLLLPLVLAGALPPSWLIPAAVVAIVVIKGRR